MFTSTDYLERLSNLSRAKLLEEPSRDREWVLNGTKPEKSSFRAFNIAANGLLVTFDEYQVDCFAAGPQVIAIPAAHIADIVHARITSVW
jgi:hypothetical protein